MQTTKILTLLNTISHRVKVVLKPISRYVIQVTIMRDVSTVWYRFNLHYYIYMDEVIDINQSMALMVVKSV